MASVTRDVEDKAVFLAKAEATKADITVRRARRPIRFLKDGKPYIRLVLVTSYSFSCSEDAKEVLYVFREHTPIGQPEKLGD